jgi:hypothetical protein
MHDKKVKGFEREIGLITLRGNILEKGQHTEVCWQGDQFHTPKRMHENLDTYRFRRFKKFSD